MATVFAEILVATSRKDDDVKARWIDIPRERLRMGERI
jgi:hypothetical protein